MKYQTFVALFAGIVSAACDQGGLTGATNPEGTAALSANLARASESSARSGDLVVRKECHLYSGQAGQICTITESNVKAIEVGSTVTYASAAVNGQLDTDVTLDLPGPGNNAASGHCTLSLVTGIGECRFSGGTGKFTHFQARVDVSPLGWPDFQWRGTYSFGK